MAATKTIVTDLGKALIAKAIETGITVKLKTFAVGDGGGIEYTPSGKETTLVHENWRANIGSVIINPKDNKELLLNTPIPEDVGGWWIREYGVFDEDGNLILIGTTNESYKSTIEEGDVITIDFNLSLTLQNISSIQFIVDPAAYVTHNYLENADYPINGKIKYKQRPQCDGSTFALMTDIAAAKLPDVHDDGIGTVTIQQPDGSAAKMVFSSKLNPNIYTTIDGATGQITLHGGKLTLFSNS